MLKRKEIKNWENGQKIGFLRQKSVLELKK
jgi:hypothetical protein